MHARTRHATPGYREVLGSFLAYVAVTVGCALPWLGSIGHAIPTGPPTAYYLNPPVDHRLIIWALTWVANAVETSPVHVFDANVFHPVPGQLTGTEHLFAVQLAFLPLEWLTGNPVAAANLCLLLSYPLAATAMERLLRRLGIPAAAAWATGLMFAVGPLRVPAHIQSLQYLNLFLPLVALAIVRLRTIPGGAAVLSAAAVVSLAILSSYYMAVLAALSGAAWITASSLTDGGLDRRDLGRLGIAVGAALGLMLLVSLPYIDRVGEPYAYTFARYYRSELIPFYAEHGLALVGVVPLLLAAAGVGARLLGHDRTVTRLVTYGSWQLAIAAGFVVLASNLLITGEDDHSLARLSSVFRCSWRSIVLVGFGTALLAGAGLGALQRRFGVIVVGVAIAGTLLTQGLGLARSNLDEIRAIADRDVYRRVAELATPPGPLLEMYGTTRSRPLPTAESMLGSRWHGLPLVNGFLGYPPRHVGMLEYFAARATEPDALRRLGDATGLRWLLLSPEPTWRRPATRDALLALPVVTTTHDVEGWTLARLDTGEPTSPWYAALSRRPAADETVLGTPIAPLKAEAGGSTVTGILPARIGGKRGFPLTVTVTNTSDEPWPVLTPRPHDDDQVRIAIRWSNIETGELVREAHATLPYDVRPRESVQVRIVLHAPPGPRSYRVDIRPHQASGQRFSSPRTTGLAGTVHVGSLAARPR